MTRWEWTWAALLAAAVAVIVTVGNPTAGHSRASLETWTAVVAVLGPALVLCVIGAGIWSGPGQRGAAGGGVRRAVGPVRGADQGRGGPARRRAVVALLRTPELYAWALVAVAGTAWQQSSFRAGALTASLPTMTVAEPVVGVGARRRRARRGAAARRRRLADPDRRGGGDGGRDGRAGPRRGGRAPPSNPR